MDPELPGSRRNLSIERGENLMRRASTCLAVLGLALLAIPGVASATPTVTAKAKIVPIPKFPGTGDKLGAGAAVQFEATITGTEYGGYPPPIVGVNTFFPKGVILHPQGFKTCTPAILKNSGLAGTPDISQGKESAACSVKSKAGPEGHANGIVSFGTEKVPERAEIWPVFKAGGGLMFLVSGKDPASFEIVSTSIEKKTSIAPYGPEFVTEVPLIETVPGANYASALSISVQVGAAYKQGKKTISYGTVPKVCPKAGFPGKAEVIFEPSAGVRETVAVTLKVPCPKK
jgi:hypothetical protein